MSMFEPMSKFGQTVMSILIGIALAIAVSIVVFGMLYLEFAVR